MQNSQLTVHYLLKRQVQQLMQKYTYQIPGLVVDRYCNGEVIESTYRFDYTRCCKVGDEIRNSNGTIDRVIEVISPR